jgi:hypothetical protein
LRFSTGEVERDVFTGDAHRHADAHGPGHAPVVVAEPLRFVAAVRHPRDAVAQPPLGGVEDLYHAAGQHVGAIPGADLAEPLAAGAIGGDLRPQVARPLARRPRVHEDGAIEAILDAAARDEPATGNRRPSWKMLVESPDSLPGTRPPTSAWCAVLATKPISTRSANTGAMIAMSFRWDPALV